MDLKQLTEIEERAKKATSGPWVAKIDFNDNGHTIKMATALEKDCIYESQHIIEYNHNLYPDDGTQYQEAEANAKFIAHAREDVPVLCQALRESMARETAMRDIVKKAQRLNKNDDGKLINQYVELILAVREYDEIRGANNA